MCWLMLLPSGRWNSHCRVVDVEWLMLLPLGRCYSPGTMILLQFQFWDVEQNLIPYMWQMVFANISIQGLIVDPDAFTSGSTIHLDRSTSEVIDGVNNHGTTVTQPVTNEVKTKGHIIIPYTEGLCESIKKICGRYGIQTHFKGGRTIKNLLVSPKDKDPMVNQSGVIYWHQCGDLGCDEEYIGETSRTFGERYKEHLKVPSAIHHHSNQTCHPTSHNNFQIIGREGHNLAKYKGIYFIRVDNPTLNNNIGKFNLPHIWDRVLLNTPGLNLKRQVNNNITQSN